jgi:RimJ/RimL family protein N-acetyltransferase
MEQGEYVKLPEATIETLARSFFREADTYGFQEADYLRFVSHVLDMSIRANGGSDLAGHHAGAEAPIDVSGGLPITDGTMTIRALDRSVDFPLLERWVGDAAGRYFLLSLTVSRTLALEEIVDEPGSVVGIIALPDGRPIGSMVFLHMDVDQHKAELRKLIGDVAMRGKGYAKAATRLWIAYGLQVLHLHKIYLKTLETNLRNVRLNEDLGFRVEGILRDEIQFDGHYHDVLRMALCRE